MAKVHMREVGFRGGSKKGTVTVDVRESYRHWLKGPKAPGDGANEGKMFEVYHYDDAANVMRYVGYWEGDAGMVWNDPEAGHRLGRQDAYLTM